MKLISGKRKVADSKDFGRKVRGVGAGGTAGAPGHCPACQAEVPAKPGFRFTSLKCPKCGAAIVKK